MNKNNIDSKRFGIFAEIDLERKRQEEKWGEQNHPMVLEDFDYKDATEALELVRRENDSANKKCWHNILAEEFMEAFLETDPKKQREEMVQVAAVAVQIIECLDRKNAAETEADEPDAGFGYCSRCENILEDCVCNDDEDAFDSRFWGDSDRDIDPDMGAH